MHANMPTLTLKGNSTAGAAAPTDLTVSATMTMLGAAPLASPTFTGTPAAPTATAGTATTQLATTAFVGTALTNANVPAPSSATPSMNGTGAPGVAVSYSRGDHVHPSDTSRAPLVSPTFTGTPAAPTPATADNSTTLATTAYVKAQGYLTGNQTITLSGDITGSGTTAITTTLPTVNANVGTFQGITVNGKGQVTAAVSQVGTANPLMDGAVAVGTSLLYSRQDHVHPSDTSRAPTASPTFTGTATFSGATFNGTVTYTGTASEHHNVSSGTGAGIWFDSITTGADRFFLGTDAGVADNFRLYSILAGANVLAYQANATLVNGSWLFSGNLTVTNNAAVQSTTASTSTTTGALVVTGGVGVGGSLNVGGPKITGPSFGASGASHAQGLVPDPGATAGTTRFLREDATWQTAGGGAAVYIQDTAPTTGMTAGSLWWNSTNGQLFVYYNDGTSSQWVFATPPAPQGILTVKETFFTASGTYTPSLGMVYCIAECVGGGGGGGGSSGGASLSNSGGGGGGGGYAKRVLTVAQIGASQSVTIGAAGANGTGGGSPTNGSAGGDTYLGLVGSPLLLAKGGAGGVTATAGSLYPGGVGGAASSGVGDIRIDGGEGGIGLLSSVAQVYVPSGFGGNSMWGPVTPGVCAGSASAVNGKVGKGYGAGGSGSEHIQTTGTASGGSGSAGAMLIMEFCTQ
jgi:hypothetical protein